MNKIVVLCVLILCGTYSLTLSQSWAQAKPVAGQSTGTVKQALEIINEVGSYLADRGGARLQQVISTDLDRFHHQDLFPIIFNAHGRIIAHGRNSSLVGRSALLVTDTTGKQFFLLGFEALKNATEVAVRYQWIHPYTRKKMNKTLYMRKKDQWIIAVSVQDKSK